MRNIFLETKQIQLVEIEEEDLRSITKGINNHEITQYLMIGDTIMSLEHEREWIDALYKQRNTLVLGIWLPEAEKLIGNVSLDAINRRDQHATLGIVIYDAKHLDRGIGSEVVSLILTHAFTRMNLHSIRLSVLEGNDRAKRCYERCGFETVGAWPKAVFKEGVWHDEILMVATRKKHKW